MSRHRKDPLRPLTAEERQELTGLSRSLSAPAAHVERARALLAIADGASYTAAAEQDGTATWSLSLLQKALRQADDGLPKVSTSTIWRTLHEAGLSWQKSRTWCETGVAMRKRKHGVVRVSDPDAAVKRG